MLKPARNLTMPSAPRNSPLQWRSANSLDDSR
jgi:hypothetical protein